VEEKFKKHIQEKHPQIKNAKLLLTVSGGIDSVMLTHLLHKIGSEITIAHCNFCLRGKESDTDQQFVEQLAKTLNVPIQIKQFNTKKQAADKKQSIQEAARELRYQWFKEVRQKEKLDYIITAHNLNDSLETLIINLTRGTGIKGLTGIVEENGKIVRPLLAFTRDEITKYAEENNYKWREDKTNADTKYTRNKIRHKVIPVLQELNPNLLETFKQTLINLKGSEAIVKESVQAVIKKVQEKTEKGEKSPIKFSIKKLKEQKNQKAYIHEIFTAYKFTNTKDIEALLTAQSGKQIYSKTHRLVKDRDYLLLVENTEEIGEKREIKETDTEIEIQNLRIEIQHISGKNKEVRDKNQAQFDKKMLKFPLTVRKWQKGDYFYPKGMRGKKKLSKYFKDEKISLIEKENIWLLLSEEKIVWIIGKRQDERFKITESTTEKVKITIN